MLNEVFLFRIAFRAILTLITSMVLLIPVVVLSFIGEKSQAVVTVAICTALIAVILAVATDCRNHEIIMAVSA
jgi:hypothetical protein